MLQIFLLGQFSKNQRFDPETRPIDDGLRPVDIRVEFGKPGVSEYKPVSPEVHDKEPSPYLLPSLRHYQVPCVGNVSRNIKRAVDALDGPHLAALFASYPECFGCFVVSEICRSVA